ncbi:Adenylosuccinate lyase [Fusarium odoratissimum]|uniref:Adenylosuccinate lyase n=1 Tax=Fusarium oxysporum f. sp. cubense (strain race 4) TaxID=2502994 RepID=N1RDC5_FUSC4|nr:Adenylosuccinate lyase [Fusarium odoratissimum]
MLELVRPHASLEPSIDQILLKTRLWLLLVGLRKSLAITTDALEQMKQHLEVTDQDFETARAEELIRRHDVMAHVHAFGAVAPAAASIMHYGNQATSCFKTDNTKLILMRNALDLLLPGLPSQGYLKSMQATTTLAYTHLQPDSANGRLVGKRVAQWAENLTHKVDLLVANAICDLGAKAQKLGTLAQGFVSKKRNTAGTLAARWMEGSLDDSAIRIDLPETFILTDAIIDSLDSVTGSMLKPELYIGCRVEIVEHYCDPEGTAEKKVQPYRSVFRSYQQRSSGNVSYEIPHYKINRHDEEAECQLTLIILTLLDSAL